MAKQLINYLDPLPMPGVDSLEKAVVAQGRMQKIIESVILGEYLEARQQTEALAEEFGIQLDYTKIAEADELAAEMAQEDAEVEVSEPAITI